MKLKCNDGIIRSFSVARADGDRMPDGSRFDGFAEAKCEEVVNFLDAMIRLS